MDEFCDSCDRVSPELRRVWRDEGLWCEDLCPGCIEELGVDEKEEP